jgi:hypothetical protein
MSTQPKYLNPRVPALEDCYFEPGLFKSIPWTYSEIGLERDEFAYLIFGFLKCNNPAAPNSHWWSYKKQAETLKLGRSTISFINQLLENSGIVKISRKKGKSNVYRYALIRPDQIKLFREIVEEERAALQKIYTHDGKLRRAES